MENGFMQAVADAEQGHEPTQPLTDGRANEYPLATCTARHLRGQGAKLQLWLATLEHRSVQATGGEAAGIIVNNPIR